MWLSLTTLCEKLLTIFVLLRNAWFFPTHSPIFNNSNNRALHSHSSLPALRKAEDPVRRCVNGVTDTLQFLLSKTAYLHIQVGKKGWSQGRLNRDEVNLMANRKLVWFLKGKKRRSKQIFHRRASFECFTSKRLFPSAGEVRAQRRRGTIKTNTAVR